MTEIIQALIFSGFALLGRWMQLHPERVVPEGTFMRHNTVGARLFRAQIVVIGTMAVFGGTYFALSTLVEAASFDSVLLGWVFRLVALVAAVLTAIYVRKEVNARPAHQSTNPYGWWP